MKRAFSLLRNEWVLLGLITLIAFFFRFYQLDIVPLGLHSDEAVMGYHARRILQAEARPIFFEENRGQEPMKMYLTALLLPLVAEDALAIRLGSAVAGLINVPLLYLLVKELLPVGDDRTKLSPVGLTAALILALSYWHVSYSRLGMEPILLPLFITTASYFFWRGVNSGGRLHYLLAGLFMGLSLYTYRGARLFPLMILTYIICYVLLARRLDPRLLAKCAIVFAVAFLVFAPLGYFALTHFDVYFTRAGDVSIFNPELNQGSPLRALLESAAKTMASFHLLPDPNWRQNPAARPLLDPVTGLLFLLGLGVTVLRWRKPNHLFILVWLLVMSLPAVMTASGMPHSSRSIGLLPVACILPALGLHEATERLRRRKAPNAVSRLWLPVLIVLFLAVALFTYRDYFSAWSREELPSAFDVAFVEAAKVMNSLNMPGGVWILPLTSLADPGSVHYTVEFLYRGDAPHHFVRVDEATIAEELTNIARGHDEARVIEWNQSILGGAYLYHADQKGILPFLLSKYGQELGREEYQAYDVVRYRLPTRPDFAIAQSVQRIDVSFDSQTRLLGVAFGGSSQHPTSMPAEVEAQLLPSGKNVWVSLQWEALDRASRDYKAAVYLVDTSDRLLGQMDKLMLSNELRTTSKWSAGQVEMDYYTLPCPPATPPGEYYIDLAVYDAQTLQRLPVVDPEGKIRGQSVRIGTVQVIKPLVPPQVEPQMAISEGDMASGISLLGYDFPLREVDPGGIMRVALYWRALQRMEYDYFLTIELKDEMGQIWAEQTNRPVDGTYPTSEWDEGEVVRDWHDVGIPAATPPGRYETVLKVMVGDVTAGELGLGEVEVRGRPHYFSIPEIEYPLDMMLGESIRLLGYSIDDDAVAPRGVLWLTLYWQALGEMSTSYTVFTHLLDADSQTWAQKDSVPGSGTLPTTGWIAGEVITDIYDLVVDPNAPPGEYVLEIGVYDVVTGERLPIFDSTGETLGNRVLLPTINVLQ